MSASSELENYRIQLQQVEAALVAEPENDELLKLKEDLIEIINLQQEVVAGDTSSSGMSRGSQLLEKMSWKVGDRCLAPSKNGQKYVAVIDGISQDKVAITFTGNGTKHMVKTSELQIAPTEEKKKYIFDSGKGNNTGPKKEWQLERERRKARAQKKEQRKKTMDETKEQEKNKWLNFNAKASTKGMKGLKRVEASSSSQDGPKVSSSRKALISSRKDYQAFGATQRGNMDSLF